MLGIEDYGSDSGSEEKDQVQTPVQAKSIALPAPSQSTSTIAATTKVKAKRLKKITIGLPSLPASQDDEDGEGADGPPAKRLRRTGVGGSSLLSMLPAPKQIKPVPAQPERILGSKAGPGLVFNVSQPSSSPAVTITASDEGTFKDGQRNQVLSDDERMIESTGKSLATSFLPPSLARGRPNISLEEVTKAATAPHTMSSKSTSTPSTDFFSLDSVSNKSTTSDSYLSSVASSASKFSSAPEVPTFEPPEPTPTDTYPGYYQLPSGAWATYDPTYYATFLKKWQDEYDAQVRALEKGTARGFEGYESGSVQEIDTAKEMERAKVELKEREEKKALTRGAGAGPSAPKMKITASKMSGIAKTRHQLATLLRDAYQNREALEEQIAEAKRNRKEAGNKYGF
ncbi:hypothetical protein AX17_003381 [Amanita inopinata Kibby_2008]|nr:hypothetical protein AX17_003381 [Amanita inopinata Kibby_2008]